MLHITYLKTIFVTELCKNTVGTWCRKWLLHTLAFSTCWACWQRNAWLRLAAILST